jgi:uncharacterized membrane protein YozB (DUF420 family)
MDNILNGPGFLGTFATFHSDAALVLILLSSLLLTVGWQLRVHKHPKAHCPLQAVAVILNTAVVAEVMIRSYIANILPGLPGKLFSGINGIAILHGIIGVLSVLLGMFVVLRAYHQVPQALRFHNFKLFMRASYLLFVTSAVLGVYVYLILYAGG